MKPKVLYIDDEAHALISFKACFREHFRVYTAISASDGLNLLKTHFEEENIEESIQVIVSDQRMPVMTGSSFFTSIIKDYPDPIRVLLTGYSDMPDLIDAVNNGKIFSYHLKPIIEEKLLKDLFNACKMFQLQMKKKILSKDLEVINEQLEFMIRQKLLS
jgi:DNA-binding NtrC family response regulator